MNGNQSEVMAPHHRGQLAKARFCLSFLFMNGFLPVSEYNTVNKRLRKYKEKYNVSVTAAQGESVDITYNDEAKVINGITLWT